MTNRMRRAARARRERPLALAYVRVSTEEQATEGESLGAQEDALRAEAARRGWDVEVIADEGVSAKSLDRPGMADALGRLDRGEADVLLAVRTDRVSRSVRDVAVLAETAKGQGWHVALLDGFLDTTSPASTLMTHVLASVAQFERELIGQRTREAMAKRRSNGAHMGRPFTLPEAVRSRIVAEREAGSGWTAIAASLNADAVPTARGGRAWAPATVRAVYLSADRAAAMQDGGARA
ncbi:recombinase family protein [Phycicoccus sp. 3266]|uniref:recombinase family protein n=1 Tax=Phycicoccus sp. 3266 TaxID=2817751 RepID=UPI00286186AB|nr:recombinase family protein [Phycicoccus sp. 3266]MDR6862175.1 DNA invertase Pin-like site-specific DNA recombinase [Phycicoccus sp. 3266]